MKMNKLLRIFAVAAALCIALSGCGVKTQYPYGEDAPSLKDAFSDDFRVGAAINTWDIEDPNSNNCKTIVKQFNTLVLENESKPESIHPEEDRYYFDKFDMFVDFCEEHDITPRGHTLVWHSQVPNWFFKDGNGDASAELVLQRMRDHITTVVTRYKGRVKSWDVVNEVIGDDGQLRFSEWSRLVGDYDGDGDKYDFIEEAFRAAREADPDARLMINDYSIEASEDKAIRMYTAVKQMLSEDVPIDGIGFQMHIGKGQDPDQLRKCFEILGRLREIKPDLIFEVTELDVNCYGWNQPAEDVKLTKDFIKEFNKTYTDTFTVLKELSDEGYLDSVIMWGLHDGVSWLNNGHKNYPMLIDSDLKLKEAAYEVMELAG